MRKFLATLLALVMTLALMVPASWGENKETYQLPDSLEGKTVILHTNDVHGAIDKYAKVAALRDECYDKGAHQVILLDAGDFSQGSPYVSLSKGATALDMMALVGYDVITLGNHEFDYGFPQLMENLKKHQGDFMVACNNLVDDEGELIFAPGGTAPIYADDTYETELFRIAIVGMATPETQTKANPALMKGLSFIGGKDLYKVTQENVDMARSEGNADIVIALGHLGVDKSSEPNCSYNVMQNVKGIDLFIDGHSHTVMTASKDNSMVQSTGTGLAYVGAIIIDNATKKYDPQTTPYPSGSGKATYYGPASINRVTINSVNGKAFDPNKTYAVVTNNFCAAGGDTYYAFAAASSQFDTGLPLDEVLMDYITTELKGVVGEQYAQPQGRITITLPAEEPTTPTKPESPKTADTGVVVYGLVAVMAAGAAVVVTSKKRKAI